MAQRTAHIYHDQFAFLIRTGQVDLSTHYTVSPRIPGTKLFVEGWDSCYDGMQSDWDDEADEGTEDPGG